MTWLAFIAAAVPVVAFLFSLGCWCGATDCSSFCIETWSSYSTGTDISTPSSCGWTEVNGDSTIVANGLSFTTALASASCNTNPAGAEILLWAIVKTSSGGGTDDARLLLDFVDNSNYLAAEFKHVNGGTSTISLIRRTAGVETTVKSKNLPLVVTASNDVKLCAYWDGTTVLFSCDGGLGGAAYGRVQMAVSSESVTNAKYGLGSGNTVTNSIVFTDSHAQNFASPTPSSGLCEDCFVSNSIAQRNDTANKFTVTLSGVSCGGLNTSFTVTPGDDIPTVIGTAAGWALTMTPISGFDGIVVRFQQNGANVDIYVEVTDSLAFGGPKTGTFYKANWKTSWPTTGIDSISALNIPYSSQSAGIGCDFSSATCTITAVDPITS